MKIFHDHSYNFVISAREGIMRFNSYLFKALLDNSDDITITILTREINVEELKKAFSQSLLAYPDRFIINVISDRKSLFRVNYLKVLFFLLLSPLKIFSSKEKKRRHKNKILKCFRDNTDRVLEYFKCDFDILFSSSAYLNSFDRWNKPHVFLLHDLFTIPLADLFRESVPDIDKMNTQYIEKLSRYAARGTYFINTSKYIQREQLVKYISNVNTDRCFVVPFPPMIKNFSMSGIPDKRAFKDKYGIADVYIAYPSRNRSNKNWILIFKALDLLRKRGVSIQFVTTGCSKDVEATKHFVEENHLEDLILEVGSLPENELYALYKYADLVVASTIIEGLGISGQALEALKMQVPVIHAKSMGIEESLESVGLNMNTADLNWVGLNDAETLADKILEVLNDPQTCIEKQKNILEAYTKRTWNEVAEDFIGVFKKSLEDV